MLVVSDLKKNFWRIDGFGEKKAGIGGFACPYSPPLFVNSNRCNISPPHAERPESRSRKLCRYVTVDDGGNYVTTSRFKS